MSKFLIGKFTLQSIEKNNRIITAHHMYLTFEWEFNAKGVLVPGSLRSFPYQNEHENFVLMRDTSKNSAINN